MSQSSDPSTGAESYGDYSVDDEDQPGDGDDLVTGDGTDVVDELDRGYSPPEKWSVGQGYGNTPYEEAVGETLAQRLSQEEPEPGVDVDERDEQWEAAIDDEVGDRRAGRLVAGDEGRTDGVEQDVVGVDVGIDGAAASAEEAAMHVIDDTEDENTF